VSFYFDVNGNGPTVFLGPSEARLMEVAWTQSSLTVKSALFHLGETSGTAYTTVSTLLNRLREKGLLSRRKKGRNFVYEATIGREEFIRTRVAAVQVCLKRNFADQPPAGS
jgi:predicted transcriptional regulator